MSLKEKITAEIKDAMKAKDTLRVSTLRFLHSAVKNKEIEVRPKELTDDDVIAVIKKSAKQRKDSIEQYTKAGRKDLADKEQQELEIIEVYLPAQMSKEQVEAIIADAMTETGASSMKEMGAVMKIVQEKTKGTADNKLVSEIVRAKLQ